MDLNFYVPEDKAEKSLGLVRKMMEKSHTVTKLELQSLIGHLAFF
jgi:hypothetical protein